MSHTSERATARVRAADPADHGAIREVIRRAYAEYASTLSPDVFRAYLDDLTDLDSRPGADLLVAEAGSEIAGAVTYYRNASAEGLGWPRRWAGVRALAVDPAHRGLGVARLLMRTCVERAVAAGAPVVCLHTASFMPAAVRLYEGLDFRRAPDYDIDVTPLLGVGGDPVMAIAYTQSTDVHGYR
jgi:predicted N-acetyltransferase YhbS